VIDKTRSGGENFRSRARRDNLPVFFLPSITKFDIVLGKFNRIFELFGIKTRVPSRLYFWSYRNNGPNRFVYHMMRKLQYLSVKAAKNDDVVSSRLFWKCAWRLMRSESFKALAYNKVRFGWQRNLPL
jgi:hypothetical protein